MYNRWYTKEKENDEQLQCDLCKGWDKYIYNVQSSLEHKEIIICFQCYHANDKQKYFDDIL
ncbi:hypothetical protein [Bacillus sp. JJ1562]|uniref:hypothetical protein n=1 Tax=Bacillus sp. JJ1562 TaxID=3122960 RepID=UPI00300295F1